MSRTRSKRNNKSIEELLRAADIPADQRELFAAMADELALTRARLDEVEQLLFDLDITTGEDKANQDERERARRIEAHIEQDGEW